MEHLGNWVKVLIVVVLLGNLVDFILPKGDLKRYGGLVVGLVILATVVSPLWSWMHQLGQNVTASTTNWTDTASGFSEVVQSEELHQAEAIVLNMPGVVQCRLAPELNGGVVANVQARESTSQQQIVHYVRSALKVTMGQSPHVDLVVTRVSG